MGRLENKNIIITGASRGIGESAARLFTKQGARLLLVARGEKGLRQVAGALGGETHVVAADVASEDGRQAIVTMANEAFDEVHGVYLNAGTAPFAPVEAVTPGSRSQSRSVE